MGPAIETTASQTRRSSLRQGSTHSLIRSWDAFDRLFDEAFAPTSAKHQSISENFDDLRSNLSPLTPLTPLTPLDARAQAPSVLETPNVPNGAAEVFSSDDEDFKKLWEEATARKQKMTKTIVRKRTLHQGSLDMVGPGVTTVSRAPSRLKRRKSRFHLKPNHDADYVTAVFDLPDVRKEDIHVAYQFDRLTITWESTSVFERQERDGTLVRERKERKYARTLPLPPGTPFSDVHAYLEDGQLSVTYPKFPATPLSHLPLRPVSLIQ